MTDMKIIQLEPGEKSDDFLAAFGPPSDPEGLVDDRDWEEIYVIVDADDN